MNPVVLDAIDVRIRNMVTMNRPNIDIALNDHHGIHGDYITSYSTMDRIEGTVTIQTKIDTKFDELEIAFTGVSATRVDKLSAAAAASGRTAARHRFLKLIQPIDEASLPQPTGLQSRILEAGRSYKFPFTFVVPPRMLPRSCGHRVANEQVSESHLLLPPSLGDPELSGFGGVLLDDLSPDMVKISYGIQVQLSRKGRSSIGEPPDVVIGEKSRKVRLKPAFDEQPPLNIDENPEYCSRVEKAVRKGMFKGKMGRLVMQSEQPSSFRLPAPTLHNPNSANEEVSTATRIHLRFDPQDESSAPPRLGRLTTKLKVYTYYASAPRQTFPIKSRVAFDMSQGVHSETMALSSRCVAAVEWTKHNQAASNDDGSIRRESTISTTSSASGSATIPPPSSVANPNLPYYTASILVPLALPRDKSLVPTFHTCLVSRIYSLSLHLDVASTTTMPRATLRLPVQISALAGALGEEARRASDTVQDAEWEAEQVMQPRSIAPPPEYRDFDPARTRRRSVAVAEERRGSEDAEGIAAGAGDDSDERGSAVSVPGSYSYTGSSSTLSSGAVAVCG